jgi:hypothetical protein
MCVRCERNSSAADLQHSQQAGGPRAQQQEGGDSSARYPLLLPAEQRNGVTPRLHHRAACKHACQTAGGPPRHKLPQQRLRRLTCGQLLLLVEKLDKHAVHCSLADLQLAHAGLMMAQRAIL